MGFGSEAEPSHPRLRDTCEVGIVVAVDPDRRITTICLEIPQVEMFERVRRSDGGRVAGEPGNVRLEKLRRDRRAWGSTPGASGSTATRRSPTSASCPFPKAPEGEQPSPDRRCAIAGRIMLRRGQGKVDFLQLRDWTGAIQVFIGKNQVGDAGWELASSCSTSAT